AEATPAGLARKTPIDLIKAAEYLLLVARGDPDAVVCHLEHDFLALPVNPQADSLVVARVLPRIVQQVQQSAEQRVGIGIHRRQSSLDRDTEVRTTKAFARDRRRGLRKRRRLHPPPFEARTVALDS